MNPEEICFLPAHEMVRQIRARELSAVEVMDAHIAQIERVNPAVNAIVTFLPDQHAPARGQWTRRWRGATIPVRWRACRWYTRTWP